MLSYSGALALNHHIILAVSVSCMPNPACGHTYSMNIGGVHYQGFKQKIKPRYHGLRLLHLLALTPGQEGRRPMTMRGQKRCPMLPGKSHGRRSLVDYSPWGRKESDTTERLHFHFHFETGRSSCWGKIISLQKTNKHNLRVCGLGTR